MARTATKLLSSNKDAQQISLPRRFIHYDGNCKRECYLTSSAMVEDWEIAFRVAFAEGIPVRRTILLQSGPFSSLTYVDPQGWPVATIMFFAQVARDGPAMVQTQVDAFAGNWDFVFAKNIERGDRDSFVNAMNRIRNEMQGGWRSTNVSNRPTLMIIDSGLDIRVSHLAARFRFHRSDYAKNAEDYGIDADMPFLGPYDQPVWNVLNLIDDTSWFRFVDGAAHGTAMASIATQGLGQGMASFMSSRSSSSVFGSPWAFRRKVRQDWTQEIR